MTQPADREQIESQASQWILRRDRGEFSAQDQVELETWLSSDSRHRNVYLRLLELWRFAGGLKVYRPVDGGIRGDVLKTGKPAITERRFPMRAFAAAAALTVIVSAGWFVKQMQMTYATEVGGYERLLLEDGTVAQLNTDTRIKVHFSSQRRQIELVQGEAYFDVARDPDRSFNVRAGAAVVRAVGTAFSVRLRNPERVDVLVTQGRVSVQEPTANPGPLLEAGQSAQAIRGVIHVATPGSAELARQLSWQTGVLHFKGDALAAVIAEFNRYNHRQLKIADPQLAAVEIGGSFKANDLASFVAALRRIPGMQVDESESVIRLSGLP